MMAEQSHWPLLEKAAGKIKKTDVAKYIELKRLLASRDPDAPRRFRSLFASYYRLNGARLSAEFKRTYFDILFNWRPEKQTHSYRSVLLALHKASGRLHASFASKLVAVRDESSPLFDSHVSKFFGLSAPSVGPIQFRITRFIINLETIRREYDGWAKDDRFTRITDILFLRIPDLAECHSSRVCDYLVWQAVKEAKTTAKGKKKV
jgi:hypothetical protein